MYTYICGLIVHTSSRYRRVKFGFIMYMYFHLSQYNLETYLDIYFLNHLLIFRLKVIYK